jgi:transcriptional regulator with XRE-family HTH domain
MEMRELLRDELTRRRRRFAGYSLRAFAAHLGVHHSTLLRITRPGHRLTPAMARRLGRRLQLDDEEIASVCLGEDMRVVCRAVCGEEFRPNTRSIAIRCGIPIDRVNIAIQQLLSGGILEMMTRDQWRIAE